MHNFFCINGSSFNSWLYYIYFHFMLFFNFYGLAPITYQKIQLKNYKITKHKNNNENFMHNKVF